MPSVGLIRLRQMLAVTTAGKHIGDEEGCANEHAAALHPGQHGRSKERDDKRNGQEKGQPGQVVQKGTAVVHVIEEDGAKILQTDELSAPPMPDQSVSE